MSFDKRSLKLRFKLRTSARQEGGDFCLWHERKRRRAEDSFKFGPFAKGVRRTSDFEKTPLA